MIGRYNLMDLLQGGYFLLNGSPAEIGSLRQSFCIGAGRRLLFYFFI